MAHDIALQALGNRILHANAYGRGDLTALEPAGKISGEIHFQFPGATSVPKSKDSRGFELRRDPLKIIIGGCKIHAEIANADLPGSGGKFWKIGVYIVTCAAPVFPDAAEAAPGESSSKNAR